MAAPPASKAIVPPNLWSHKSKEVPASSLLEHHTQRHPLSDHRADSSLQGCHFVISATVSSSDTIPSLFSLSCSKGLSQIKIQSLTQVLFTGSPSRKALEIFLVSFWSQNSNACFLSVWGLRGTPSFYLELIALDTEGWKWFLKGHGHCICWQFLKCILISGTLLTTVWPKQLKSL